MTIRALRWAAPAVLLAMAGCNILAYPLYLIAPSPPTKKAPPEFDGLPGSRTAIVINADMDTLYEYPYVREQLSEAIAAELAANVEEIEIIHPARVIHYQEAHPFWPTRSVGEIGKALDADYVLYVSLSEFRTHESGSIDLPIGRISAAVSVWDARADLADPTACVWRKMNLAIKVDGMTGMLAWDQTLLQIQMQQLFAQRLARHFYLHEAPKDAPDHDAEFDMPGSFH